MENQDASGDRRTPDHPEGTMNLPESGVSAIATTDVGVHRERSRSGRLRRLAMILAPVAILLVLRDVLDPGASLPVPHFPASLQPMLPAIVLITVLVLVMVIPLAGAGRSPHILYRPDELTIGFDDVRGSAGLVEEVTKTLNLFLAHRTFAEQMGGSPRKAILFEGPPGTGKTYMAKAMAAEAGVPFLFVSSSAFQSMFYGQTNRKIRAYFKALRKHARREGGAIGFIEELDAIGGARGSGQRHGEGIPGVVNELLIQLQSFEQTPPGLRVKGWFVDGVNSWLPHHRRLDKPKHVAGQHPGHRRHQPGHRPRPGPPATGPVRPQHLLRTARSLGAAGHHRLLPGQEGPRGGARRPGQPGHPGRPHRRATRR